MINNTKMIVIPNDIAFNKKSLKFIPNLKKYTVFEQFEIMDLLIKQKELQIELYKIETKLNKFLKKKRLKK